MRKLILMAPLALLAACNNSAETTEKGADAATTADASAAPEPALTVVADAENAIDWTGTYSGTDASGATVSLTLNRGDTYSMTTATGGGVAGTPVTGSFNWYRDGSRILLDDAGGNAVYAVGTGVIFRMADADAPTTGTMDRASALVRAETPAAPAQPAQ